MHASLTFQILQKSELNFLENLKKEEFLVLRKWVIELILSTDMVKHFDMVGLFKSKSVNLKDIHTPTTKLEYLKLVIHSSDIGHAAKQQDLHIMWSNLITQEFFHQGDIEKMRNFPISMYCDRETTILSKSQIGFLKNISLPLFEVLYLSLDSEIINERCLEQLKNNLNYWENELICARRQTQRISDDRLELLKNFENIEIRNSVRFDKK